MQPLKFKEYLATTRPVVTRDLPAAREWADAADLATSSAEFASLVRERAQSGALVAQLQARRRLVDESWQQKAAEFERLVLAGA